jgi:DNA-binding transcriptional ArsR family regulator
VTLDIQDRTLSANFEEYSRWADGSPQIEKMYARRASDFLRAAAHETRLLLLCLLSERERSVTDLENILGLRQPNVSQHLARLRLDGLVTTQRYGKLVYYRINNDDIKRLIAVVNDIFCGDGKEKRRPNRPRKHAKRGK